MTRHELKPHTIFQYESETRVFYVMSEEPDITMNWALVPAKYHSAMWSPSTKHSSRGRELAKVTILWELEPTPVFNDWGEDAL